MHDADTRDEHMQCGLNAYYFWIYYSYHHLESVQSRWFRLTDTKLAYFKEEAGELMAAVDLANITTVGTDDKGRVLRLMSNQRFTASGQYDLTLRVDSDGVRNKWLTALHRVLPDRKFQS